MLWKVMNLRQDYDYWKYVNFENEMKVIDSSALWKWSMTEKFTHRWKQWEGQTEKTADMYPEQNEYSLSPTNVESLSWSFVKIKGYG